MSILIDGQSRIIVQGITGYNGRNLALRMLDEGSPLMGGVTPGKAGSSCEGLPVFGCCHSAVRHLGADASFISVPAPFAKQAAAEALDAGIRTVVVYTEGVPIRDAIEIRAYARYFGATVLGPNAAGCVSPGKANLSDLNGRNLVPGNVGIVSKSGTLTYEVIDGLNRLGLGQSSVVCLGGDLIVGTGYREILERFEADPETSAVVMIGEIGGQAEIMARDTIAGMDTPVICYIAGRSAPPGKQMGHAGALLQSSDENAEVKKAILAQAGAQIAGNILSVADLVKSQLAARS